MIRADNQLEKRTWSPLDTFVFFVRIFWVVFNVSINLLPLYTESLYKMILVIWSLIILVVPYLFNRPGKIHTPFYLGAEFILTGGTFIYLVSNFSNVGSDILSIISFPLFTISFVSQSRPFLWISPILSTALLVTGVSVGGFWGDGVGRLIDIAMLYGFGFMLGRIVTMNHSIQEKNRTLEQYSKRIEELTIREERIRVSRDMHDTVGHIFTSIIASLDALPFIVKANQEAAVTSIKELSVLARKGLTDVRKTIHQLTGETKGQSLGEICKNLVDDFSEHTGTIVDFQMIGNEVEIGEGVKHALMRGLQESLTNAKRHGHATVIKVSLQFTDSMISLQIKDNGTGFNELQLGFGLNSMKDRLITLGGHLHIESNLKQGTTITCTVPVPKEWVEE